jgi:hypothetical protein
MANILGEKFSGKLISSLTFLNELLLGGSAHAFLGPSRGGGGIKCGPNPMKKCGLLFLKLC